MGQDAALRDFRAELRGWLDTHPRTDPRAWQAELFDAGWLVPSWPRTLGGRDATPEQTLAYFEELAHRKLRRTENFQGLNIVAPSLRDFGTPAQQERWLVPTLRADVLWCIGMSEPNAGSDLGGLRTRADVTEDGFVVNGQKVWTSNAHEADWCMLYVRTDPQAAKHAGISVVVVDMKTQGVDVRPFAHLTGDVDFAEVFLTDAFVPRENLVGELNRGWSVTVASLAHERSGLWVQAVADLEATCASLVDLARTTGRLDDPVVRRDLAQAHEQVASLRALGYQGFATMTQQRGSSEHSLLKLAAAELGKQLAEMGLRLLGPWGPVTDAPERGADGTWPRSFFVHFAATIAGGTSEVQRNIIAERVLGLPRSERTT